MKRILEKLVKLFPDTYVSVQNNYDKHSHLNHIIIKYKVYIADYVFNDNKKHFSDTFNTLKELEQYLKENVTNYK